MISIRLFFLLGSANITKAIELLNTRQKVKLEFVYK